MFYSSYFYVKAFTWDKSTFPSIFFSSILCVILLGTNQSEVVKVVLVVDPQVLLVRLTIRAIRNVLHIGPFAVEERPFEQLKHQAQVYIIHVVKRYS